MNPVGIMQGRLSPATTGRPQAFPVATWRDEFAQAAAAGFKQIEWLVTAEHYSVNPLLSDAGIDAIAAAIAESGVSVSTLCADFLINDPLVRAAEASRAVSIARLVEVATRSRRVGVDVIVVPILEHGEIRSDAEAGLVAELLRPVARVVEAQGQRLAIESQLPAADVVRLIDRCGSPSVGACYDVGNAAAIGADCGGDVRRLGQSIFEVHIKDRLRNGPSVTLGTGAVKFTEAFQELGDIDYDGPLILETPVGADPIGNARRHFSFVQQHLAPGVLTSR